MKNLKKFKISKEKQKNVKGGEGVLIPTDLYGKCPVGYCASNVDKGMCKIMRPYDICTDQSPQDFT